MAVSDPSRHTEIRGREATVSVRYGSDTAFFSVWTGDGAGAAAEAARLACEAVHQARVRAVHRVVTALQPANPACSVVLQALRRRLDNDLEQLVLRRAGSTVLVSLDLRPWPVVPRPAGDRSGALVPTQPVGDTGRGNRTPGTVPATSVPAEGAVIPV